MRHKEILRKDTRYTHTKHCLLIDQMQTQWQSRRPVMKIPLDIGVKALKIELLTGSIRQPIR